MIDGPAAAIEWGATAGLHAFQKKSPRGIRTAQHDVDPVSDRLKVARTERQTKVRLAFAIDGIPEQRHLTSAEAAPKLGVNQPKISALSNYRLGGFSVERIRQVDG